MPANPYHAADVEPQVSRVRPVPAALVGAIVAEAIWGVAIFGSYAFDAYEPMFPAWFKQLDLPDTLGTICGVIAAPVALGGWLLIWGDRGPPYPWLDSITFNLAFGFLAYGLLGLLIGTAVGRERKGRRRHNERTA